MVLSELKDKLKLLDEVTLLEVLELNSEDLVEGFHDHIEEHYDRLIRVIGKDDEDETETD